MKKKKKEYTAGTKQLVKGRDLDELTWSAEIVCLNILNLDASSSRANHNSQARHFINLARTT
jgi:hypothetical protein